ENEPDEGNQEAEAGEEDEVQPRNRTEFYSLFKNKGPTKSVAGFMADRSVKHAAHILCDVTYPLENFYYETLEMISKGWMSQQTWESRRSVG
ncbi:unnamed protein product, partial [Durusdinium trenchii]